MTTRDFLEEKLLDRLTKTLPTDEYVGTKELEEMMQRLSSVYYRVANNFNIPGFTEDDLIFFMQLKTYQMMRRGKFEEGRSPIGLAYLSFSNLFRDALRIAERARRLDLVEDVLDFSYVEITELDSFVELAKTYK